MTYVEVVSTILNWRQMFGVRTSTPKLYRINMEYLQQNCQSRKSQAGNGNMKPKKTE